MTDTPKKLILKDSVNIREIIERFQTSAGKRSYEKMLKLQEELDNSTNDLKPLDQRVNDFLVQMEQKHETLHVYESDLAVAKKVLLEMLANDESQFIAGSEVSAETSDL